MVVVLFTRLPGRHRGLVSPETAELLVRFGLARILDAPPDPGRPALRLPRGQQIRAMKRE